MSDLQIGLLAIGVVVVVAVYLYNAWQERRLRRRLQEAFGDGRDDALMQAPPEPAPARSEPPVRVEPQLQAAFAGDPGVDPEPAASPPAQALAVPAVTDAPVPVPDVPWFDDVLDYVAEIRAAAPVSAATVAELLSKGAATGKPCRAAGYDDASGTWEELNRTGAGRHARVRFAVQLVSRSGPLAAPQLSAFSDAVRAAASRTGAAADCPDTQAALRRARELDEFCADVDVAIGVNVVAPAGAAFSGADIRAAAEGAGFKLESGGVFHYRGADRHTLFTLDNHEPLPFIPEQMTGLSTSGVTLLLDVPRVSEAERALDAMLDKAQRLAEALGGRVVDDNRVPLNASGIAAIRQQLDGIASAMAARGVAPGGERALRLFS